MKVSDELESIRDMAREEGLAAGHEEAIRMYDKNYSIAEIADILNLSEEDVTKYANGF